MPKSWKDKKHDRMNEWKKYHQPTPFWNVGKNFPRKYFHSNNQNTQGWGRLVNLGTKKFGDSPREPLKWWEWEETRLRRNWQCLTSAARTTVNNLQEASRIGDVGRSIHRINAIVDGRHDDHQSTIVEVEGKVNNNYISILIDPRATLSYVTLGLVDSNKIKKVKHAKS